MVQRGHTARFMGGAWVFPGGIVDDLDDGDLARSVVAGATEGDEVRWIGAGLRELVEEVRIWITTGPIPFPSDTWLRDDEVYEAARDSGVQFDSDRLAYFANWITPTMIPIRFDTRFYAVAVDHEFTPEPDPRELAAAEWMSPGRVIELARGGERVVPFPTMKTLEHLAGFSTAADFMAYARSLEAVPPVMPRGRIAEDGTVEIVLPGEPGYEALGDAEPDPEVLSKVTRAAATQGHLMELADGEG